MDPSEFPPSDPLTPTPETASSSFRFPTPAADERVSSWVESLSAADMSARSEAPSDEGILGESAYEFIDTDGESRDDGATESVASTDFGRPDDVASLADTDRSEEESEEEDEHTSASPAYPGHEHAVEQAFNTPTIGRSAAIILDDLEKPLAQSIEFEEPISLGAETVSVKHTVADFNEEQTADALKRMNVQNLPSRIMVTICQTMTKQGLSTRDPLRILYVGSHSAKQDIIHKIASSVTASVESSKRAQHLRHSMSQLYNVVPVTAFGSERTPEIELMHSSGYQIKVEDCMFSQTLKYEDSPEKPDVIKLTIDDNFAYHSVPEGKGFIVEPHWELPHIAVFYCSDEDDVEARRTRTIARKFMSRHSIPSIVISHRQLFDRGQVMSLDQHSIHMCLESRDSNGRGNIVHQRLPIDLASFLNIDARQMNRNLAYLTGLYEPSKSPAAAILPKKTKVAAADVVDIEKTPYSSLTESVKFIRNRHGRAIYRAVLPVGVLLLSVFAAVLSGVPSYRFYQVSSPPAISVNSKVMPAVSISSTPTTTLSSPVPSITSISTPATVKTQTRTVTVTQSVAFASSGPNSLSVLPSMEIGKIPPPVQQTAKPVNKSSICEAEVLGDREILIRIPSATKLSWLSKEAMSVNITRGNVTVDSERAYSSDEGIVLLLPKNEAWGVLNISIVTTKKPRVNETFQVDFGTTTSQAWQSLLNKLSSMISDDVITLAQFREIVDNMAEEAVHQGQSTLSHIDEFRRLAMEQAASAGAGLTDLAKSLTLEAAKRSAIFSKEVGIQLTEVEAKLAKQVKSLHTLREPLDEGLMKAQIQSKLLWLKLQGKEDEYREYEKRATEATRSRGEKTLKDKKAESKKTLRAAKKAAKKEARAFKKAAKGRA
ncbi:uncharacterized protein PAC_06907 [Phialocephala subalpina]|uniref:Uncharacterized protein n=1 Tax=Phialocephala subalpina TaxID=576137 RepID=A0A1L7WW58_9HELO|nr:uncharacterized protein PAC_06907 [Phialocephala subalpina]